MLFSKRLESFKKDKQIIEVQIANLDKVINQYNQEIIAEIDRPRRTLLNQKLKNYFQERDELSQDIDEIQFQIHKIKIT